MEILMNKQVLIKNKSRALSNIYFLLLAIEMEEKNLILKFSNNRIKLMNKKSTMEKKARRLRSMTRKKRRKMTSNLPSNRNKNLQ
jgi:hypothetical protein